MRGTSTYRKIVTFDEVLQQLSPAGTLKIIASNHMAFFFGGAQMNIEASLACFGESVNHITAVSSERMSMPKGGVSSSPASLKQLFIAGPHCQGIGSELFWNKEDGGYDYKEIKENLAAALETVASLRA